MTSWQSTSIRVGAIFCWAFLVWVLLTWTLTAEQLLFGVLVAAAAAVALAPLGSAAGPWLLLDPGRLAGAIWLLAVTGGRIAVSNMRLARRIWDPRRPLTSGMVIAAGGPRGAGTAAARHARRAGRMLPGVRLAPGFFLETVMAPAVAGLLHPARYASAVLSGAGRLPVAGIPFDYASPGELASAVASLAVAGVLAWGYLRVREPAPVRVLRAAHNGSANDYAAYAVTGTLAVIAVVSLVR